MHSISENERLLLIKFSVAEARDLARVFFYEMGYDYPIRWNIDFIMAAAAELTKFTVESCPNLRHNGERVCGLLINEDARNYLRFEEYDPEARVVFSIAHELGHFYLHLDRDLPDGIDIEMEADIFAGYFLIPSKQIREDVSVFGLSVPFLARRYGLSESVVKKRIDNLEELGVKAPELIEEALF